MANNVVHTATQSNISVNVHLLPTIETASIAYDFFLLLQTINIIFFKRAKTGLIIPLPIKIAIGAAIGVAALTVVLVPSLYFGLKGTRFDCIENQISYTGQLSICK